MKPSKYLRLSLNFLEKKSKSFRSSFEKISSKLQGKKAKLLSQARRLTVIISVLSTLPLYYVLIHDPADNLQSSE